MTPRLVLFAQTDLPEDAQGWTVQFCQQLADYTAEPVELAVVADTHLADLRTLLSVWHDVTGRDVFLPTPRVSNAPMSSAEFVWREDGRPDWAEMWTSFCDLALYGGPPHRGEDSALHAPADPDAPSPDGWDALREIRRGIWETTGLIAEPAEPGWLSITCSSRRMAAWMCASIILENVDARVDEERLLVPAGTGFKLKDEVKSVITVVAKVHHYWLAHVEAKEQEEEILRAAAARAAR